MFFKGMSKNDKGDLKYNNVSVERLIGQVLKQGKKSKAQEIVYECFDIIKQKTKKDPIDVFDDAVRNVAPTLEVKAKRIGGANYQVPVPVMGNRRLTLALRWILAASRGKKGKKMAVKLASEIIDASNKLGMAVKKKEDVHKMAEANKAFAHFAR
ncbi:MAG: 30S ribosomal protein S7 [Candidatus Moranbacteria bacterium]|nr:30S ribosomal protein S7 [Candidatus Moranbacteria bacterium]